jgi:hypothetical protein
MFIIYRKAIMRVIKLSYASISIHPRDVVMVINVNLLMEGKNYVSQMTTICQVSTIK